MFAINQHVERMQFVLLKIKMPFVSVRPAIAVIQFQMLVVNWPMHARIVQSHQCAKSHQPVTFANAHKVTLVIQNQLDASQLVNVQMAIQIARTVQNV